MITGQCNDRDLRQIFSKLDSDDDDHLNEAELENLLFLIGQSKSNGRIHEIISRLTSRGKLSFQGTVFLPFIRSSPMLALDFQQFISDGLARELVMPSYDIPRVDQ